MLLTLVKLKTFFIDLLKIQHREGTLVEPNDIY